MASNIGPELRVPDDPIGRRRFLHWLSAGVPLLMLPVGAAIPAGCSRVDGIGRGQFILVPDSQMAALSDQAWADIRKSETVCTHGPTVSAIGRICQSLTAHAPKRGAGYRITVLESEQVNAFALPNGQMAIYTGLLPYCQTEAAVATVIGHEIAHVAARHGSERMSQKLAASLVVQMAAVGFGLTSMSQQEQQLAVAALGAGSTVGLLLPFSRRHEHEADQLGVTYMAKAGYDPQAAVEFWQRFAAKGGAKPPEFFSTHPSDATRIAELNRRMTTYQNEFQQAVTRQPPGKRLPAKYAG